MADESQEIRFDMIKSIMDSLLKQKSVSDSTVQAFVASTLNALQESRPDGFAANFSSLYQFLSMYWGTEAYKETQGGEYAFQIGQLFACCQMLEECIEKHKNQYRLSRHVEMFGRRYRIFYEVGKNPGINQAELVEKTGFSASILSQFFGKVRSYSYFAETIEGRVKHYYLTSNGKALVGLLKECYPDPDEEEQESSEEMKFGSKEDYTKKMYNRFRYQRTNSALIGKNKTVISPQDYINMYDSWKPEEEYLNSKRRASKEIYNCKENDYGEREQTYS